MKKIILISLCWGEVINDDVIKFINSTSDEYYFVGNIRVLQKLKKVRFTCNLVK